MASGSLATHRGRADGWGRQHHAVLLASLVAALFVLVAGGGFGEARGQEAAGPSGAFEYALPVNAAQLEEDGLMDEALDTAKSAGVNSVSSGAVWWYLDGNSTPRQYDWSSVDRLVAGAEARGMRVSLQLSGTPDWVHPELASQEADFYKRIWHAPGTSPRARADAAAKQAELDAWYKFVQDVVGRYGGRVARYEMWNETNLPEFWESGPNPAQYAELLKSSYDAAKAVDPSATVVFAGLSRNDVGYLETYYREADRLYGAQAREKKYFFDVLGVHPYSDERSPDTNSASYVGQTAFGPIDRNFLGIRAMKRAMEAKGGAEAAKRMWLGEMGYSTTQTWMKAVPDDVRGRYLERAYALARAEGYVDGLSWYYFRVRPGAGQNAGEGQQWAIVGSDFSPTRTFEALKRATAAGGSAPAPAPAPGETPGAVVVNALWTSKPLYAPGEIVRASATLSAAGSGTLDRVVVAVRPKGGTAVLDFPMKTEVAVGTSGRTYAFEKAFPYPGVYQMFVAYEDGAGWKNLAPTSEFRVAAPAPPAPAPVVNFSAPEILYPSPRRATRDRTPMITAVVRDRQDNLRETPNVKLYVDGRRVSTTRFSYSSSTDRLRYVPKRLSYGSHGVRVVATDDHGRSATCTWRVRVVRP